MKKAIFWAAAALSLAACHTEDPLAEAEQQPKLPGTAVVLPIEADITLQDYAESRAAKQTWQPGDQLTLYEYRWVIGTLTREEAGWSIALEPKYAEYGPDNERSFEVSAFFAEKVKESSAPEGGRGVVQVYDGVVCGGFGTLQLGADARVALTLRHLTARVRVSGLTPGDSLVMTGFKLLSDYDYYYINCTSEPSSAIADEEGNAYFYVAPNRLPVDSEGNPLRERDQFDCDSYRTSGIKLEHFNADRVSLGTYVHELSEANELAAGQAVAFEMPGEGNLHGWIPVNEEDRYIYYTTADNQPVDLGGDYESTPYGDGFRLCFKGQNVLEEFFSNINNSFFRNKNITSVRLPKTIRTIGDYAFESCTQLQSIELPGNLQQIGKYVFSGCTQLQSIELPAGMEELGAGAFFNCSSLTDVVLPQGLKKLGGSCVFENCTSLTSIELPQGVTEIGKGAFYGCSSLTGINLPEGITEISDGMLGHTAIASLTIPASVKTIGVDAFSGCAKLASIVLPEKLEEIGETAFADCAQLTSVVLPKNLKTVEAGAFKDCIRLASVTFPEGLETIGFEAFSGCRLSAIDLPASIKNIDDEAFACRALKSVTCRAAVPPVLGGQNAFFATFTGPVYVPAASISAYKDAEIWWDFTFEAIP